MFTRAIIALLFLISSHQAAFAWGAQGHALVGKIADSLLTENAKAHISRIVGFSLEQSGPWLDCAKSVQRTGVSTFELKDDPEKAYYLHPQCEPFFVDASQEKARMEDYVARNWANCTYQSGTHGCHETYHFADVSISEKAYRLGLVALRTTTLSALSTQRLLN